MYERMYERGNEGIHERDSEGVRRRLIQLPHTLGGGGGGGGCVSEC